MTGNDEERPYPEVPQQPDYPEIEARILDSWERDGTFRASVEGRPAGEGGGNEFVFYDGPPFANGLPHYGHLLTGYVKDLIPRYQTMKGRRVERRFGWDCHGLPAEMEAERELGISGHAEIAAYGLDRFNDFCRKSVLKYTQEWKRFVTRQARWVDFEHDYKTMDLSYMESVMWAFKALWDKGLLYEGTRVLPYSWAAETPLSNFETRLDDSYRDRQDPALTVRFSLEPREGDGGPLDLLAWTTTPWTLPSNLALAVGPDIDYAILEKDDRRLVLAEEAVARYDRELDGARRVGSCKGRDLAGRRYAPLFPFFAGREGAFVVLAGDFVTTEDGTGIVHMAPGFGEDDMELCKAHGIDVVCPVDRTGKFTGEVPPYAGMLVFDANKQIIRDLKEEGRILRHETYVHSYPHCWRTDQPLIYKAMSSWYVKVTAIRDRMVELNRGIRWIPAHVRDGLFGKWLEGARDWSISRNRFWGAPIPVWKSDDPEFPRVDVYGSLDEIERDFGVRPKDLHRPAIDELTRPNPDDPSGKSRMRRIPDVLDCWFESGSMPYAQVHYPVENREWFENHFPADFIVEYQAQTRGWFYTMMVLATALFDRPPFRNVICHGVVLDENGQKLSKRLKNYPSPEEVFATKGSDALRWFLMSSPILKGNDLQIDHEGKAIGESLRRVLNPIWNAYYFFTLYANADGVKAAFRGDSEAVLDRYILCKTKNLVLEVETELDRYDIPAACERLASFLDALNNWYVRRSRGRFWNEEGGEPDRDAFDTLFTVLVTLCKVAAPFLPFLAEEVYRGLTGERSVHLADWPEVSDLPEDPLLVEGMDRVRAVCSAGLALRRKSDIRVRQPLSLLTVAGHDLEGLEAFLDLIRDEVNVKEVRLDSEFEPYAHFRLAVHAKVAGPRLGKDMKSVLAAAKRGDWRKRDDGRIEVGGRVLEEGESEIRLDPKEGVLCQALPGNRTLVILDADIDEDLELEGLARDLVRLIQQARKEAGFAVGDRIRLTLDPPEGLLPVLERHEAWIREQTLCLELRRGAPEDGVRSVELAGGTLRYGLERV